MHTHRELRFRNMGISRCPRLAKHITRLTIDEPNLTIRANDLTDKEIGILNINGAHSIDLTKFDSNTSDIIINNVTLLILPRNWWCLARNIRLTNVGLIQVAPHDVIIGTSKINSIHIQHVNFSCRSVDIGGTANEDIRSKYLREVLHSLTSVYIADSNIDNLMLSYDRVSNVHLFNNKQLRSLRLLGNTIGSLKIEYSRNISKFYIYGKVIHTLTLTHTPINRLNNFAEVSYLNTNCTKPIKYRNQVHNVIYPSTTWYKEIYCRLKTQHINKNRMSCIRFGNYNMTVSMLDDTVDIVKIGVVK